MFGSGFDWLLSLPFAGTVMGTAGMFVDFVLFLLILVDTVWRLFQQEDAPQPA